MTTSDIAPDQAWGMLADLANEDREAKMLQRYGELAPLPEDERQSQMVAMVRAEYDLGDEQLRAFTISRLAIWLKMDLETARRLAGSYDTVMQKLPGAAAYRRVSLVQTLRREFPLEEQERLVNLLPAVFGGTAGIRVAALARPEPAEQARRAKKGWWPFGKR